MAHEAAGIILEEAVLYAEQGSSHLAESSSRDVYERALDVLGRDERLMGLVFEEIDRYPLVIEARRARAARKASPVAMDVLGYLWAFEGWAKSP